MDLKHEISKLKKDKNAVILAHYYQTSDIQEIADCVGDSLKLAQEAQKLKAKIIVLAGVRFMAETAKIINPYTKVLIPDMNAGCSLADNCTEVDFKKFIAQYPNHVIVTYVNCSAEIKALSDIVCTSSNAVKIINSVPKDKKIIFAPDKNLGKYLINITGREMVLWDGVCIVHNAFSIDKILNIHKEHPDAKIIAHPESTDEILKAANFIGSTSELINFCKKDPSNEFIIATEAGILFEINQAVPNKKIIPAPTFEENSCACGECAYMKLNTLEKVYNCLLFEKPEIVLSQQLMTAARKPIYRMLELS